MFTGIVETVGKIIKIEQEKTNIHYWVESAISSELKIDQSVSHNGVCLTVVELKENAHLVTAIDETLQLTNLSSLQVNDKVNLERAMQMNGRLDGHMVQGHVDGMATFVKKEEKEGSFVLTFQHNHPQFSTVEKGSITINGISLTVLNSSKNEFSVAIIPYTWEHTQISTLQINDNVNLEFDIIGKYIQQYLHQMKQ